MRLGKGVTKWTKEQVEDFRQWHETRINELYASAPKLRAELAADREQWLIMVMP